MNRKQAYAEVTEQINQGKTKQEAFDYLRESFGHDDTLAKIVGAFPDKDLAIKYNKLNIVLFILLLLSAFLKIVFSIPLILSISISALPMLLIIPILNFYFASEVYKKRGYIYRILGLLAISGIFNSIEDIQSIDLLTIATALLMLFISVLSFYLGNRMFPNYKFTGPKKNSEGIYEL